MLRLESQESEVVASAAAFLVVLQTERDALNEFVALLRAEQALLIGGDADGLIALANEKTEKMDVLALMGRQRSHHLATQNLSSYAEGMEAWLELNPGFAARANKVWRELVAQAETARELNQSNGVLIEGRLQQNRLKLAVLQTSAASEGVYRSDGQLRPLRGARPPIAI